jgi:glutathione peroxidase
MAITANSTPPKNALDFTATALDGKDVDLSRWRGKVVLIVNVASKCGLTPQYTALQKLWEANAANGLVVLGFPANEFKGQEPGTDSEIQSFCRLNYGVTFPLFSKSVVLGEGISPLYSWLTGHPSAPVGPGPVSWNFEKFLIGRDGNVSARFSPQTKPDDPSLLDAVERALSVVA